MYKHKPNKSVLIKSNYLMGFTIVELLVVIVVIGILAAITIVSFSNISQRANLATLQSDLKNASTQLETYHTMNNDSYPASLLAANLKASSGTNYDNYSLSGGMYCLQATNHGMTYYILSTDKIITEGECPSDTFISAWGGTGNDRSNSIVVDSDGNYVVAGYATGFGTGAIDATITKYDPQGNILWNRAWGGVGNDYGYAVVLSNGGGYVLSGYTSSSFGTNSSVFIAKFDSSGSLIWDRLWAHNDINAYAMAAVATSDGGYAVSGYNTGFGPGGNDIFLVKFDGSGNLQWDNVFGTSSNERGWSVYQANDGGYVIAGTSNASGADDMLLLKISSTGGLQWRKIWGGAGADTGRSVIQSSDGGYVVTGYTASFGTGGDLIIVKYDGSGNLLWDKTWGGATDDKGLSVIQNQNGEYIVAGEENSFGAGLFDMMLLKFGTSGDLIWGTTWGGASYDRIYSVSQSSGGGYAVAGWTRSYGAGDYDIFAANLDSSGNIKNCSSSNCGHPTTTSSEVSATEYSYAISQSDPNASLTDPAATTSTINVSPVIIVAP